MIITSQNDHVSGKFKFFFACLLVIMFFTYDYLFEYSFDFFYSHLGQKDKENLILRLHLAGSFSEYIDLIDTMYIGKTITLFIFLSGLIFFPLYYKYLVQNKLNLLILFLIMSFCFFILLSSLRNSSLLIRNTGRVIRYLNYPIIALLIVLIAKKLRWIIGFIYAIIIVSVAYFVILNNEALFSATSLVRIRTLKITIGGATLVDLGGQFLGSLYIVFLFHKIVYYGHKKNWTLRTLEFLAGAASSFMLIIILIRGTFLALAVTMLIFYRKSKFIIIFGIAFFIVLLIIGNISEFLVREEGAEFTSGRLIIWEQAFNELTQSLDNALFGSDNRINALHNVVLGIAMDYGVLSLIPYLGIHIFAFYIVIQLNNNPLFRKKFDDLAERMIAIMTGTLAWSMFDNAFYGNTTTATNLYYYLVFMALVMNSTWLASAPVMFDSIVKGRRIIYNPVSKNQVISNVR